MTGDISIFDRLARCGDVISSWNSEVIGNVASYIAKKSEELQRLIVGVRRRDDVEKINACRKELNEWQHKEEIMWKQQAKDFWVREGDKNS